MLLESGTVPMFAPDSVVPLMECNMMIVLSV